MFWINWCGSPQYMYIKYFVTISPKNKINKCITMFVLLNVLIIRNILYTTQIVLYVAMGYYMLLFLCVALYSNTLALKSDNEAMKL